MSKSKSKAPRIDRQLTQREMEVLKYLTQGLSDQAIADTLDISERTVQAHVRNVLLKLGVRSRTQAAVTALKKRWF